MVKAIARMSHTKICIIATSAAATISFGAFFIDFSPHTFFLKKYKSIIQMYRFGEPLPLDDEIQHLFNEVLDDLKLNKRDRSKLDALPIVGFNLHHAGLSAGYFGAIIGIPINYTYKNIDSVDTSELRLGRDRESINMYHPAAENLVKSLVLSKKAQKFGIAREVLMVQKDLPICKSASSFFLTAMSIIMADIARTRYKITSVPLIFMVYGTSALLGYATWFQIRDTMTTYYEKEVDKELSKLGPDYIEGGKEFYDKILQRNVALRALLGKEGAKQFNRDGDEIFFIRHKRTPITHRKRFFSEITLEDQKQVA